MMNIRNAAMAVTFSAAMLMAASSASAFVLGPTSPGKWGPPVMGTGATITWSVMGGGLSLAPDTSPSVDLTTFMPFVIAVGTGRHDVRRMIATAVTPGLQVFSRGA